MNVSQGLVRRLGAAVVLGLLAGCGGQAALPPVLDGFDTDAGTPQRASWVSDRYYVRPGDIVTIVIDEKVSSRERTRTVGDDRRNFGFDVAFAVNGSSSSSSTQAGASTGFGAGSSLTGEANRDASFMGTISTRVLAVDANGLAQVSGTKTVKVDGREQTIMIHGIVRPEDLNQSNVIRSSRLADAQITYQGKDLGPRRGMFGSILSALWPF